jgi:hypothetical protein
MKRKFLLLVLCFFWFFEEPALAQRSGTGLFQGASMCSDVVGQVTNQTYCLDYTTGSLSVWNGTAYTLLGGNNTPFNINAAVATALRNNNSGTNAQSVLYFYNDLTPTTQSYAAIGLTSSGFTAGGPIALGDQMGILTGASHGMVLSSASTTAPIQFDIGAQQIAQFVSNTANVWANPGNVNGGVNLTLYNANGGNNAQAVVSVQAGSGGSITGTSIFDFGPGYTANAAFPANSGALVTSAANGLNIGSFNNSPVRFELGTTYVGQFSVSGSPLNFAGLSLPGFANTVGPGQPWTGLQVGNSDFTATGWAGVSISGATQYNGTNWVMDGGAGTGVGLFNTYTGVHAFYYAGGGPAGTVVSWIEELGIDGNSVHVTHIDNLQGYGVPTCVNCASIDGGSRDTAGYLQISGNWPITLNFAKPFIGSAICNGNTLNAVGSANVGIISFTNNAPSSIQINCELAGGAVCSTSSGWISYHCFGHGQ